MAEQNEPTPKKTLSKAERIAARKARIAKREARAKRAAAKAKKVTTKSTKQQKADAKVTTAILSRAELEKQKREQQRRLEDHIIAGTNWQWRKFALGLMNGKPNYLAYAEAYDMNDVERDQRAYQVAAACATQLLKNTKFREFWRDLIVEQGFNNEIVDSETVRLITDPDTPPAVRRATIRDFNELQGRIVKRNAFTDDQGKSLFDKGNTSFDIRVVKGQQ